MKTQSVTDANADTWVVETNDAGFVMFDSIWIGRVVKVTACDYVAVREDGKFEGVYRTENDALTVLMNSLLEDC